MATFDVTDKCVKFMQMSIKDMPGNPGQEVLVDQLDYSGCRFTVEAGYDGFGEFEVSADSVINIRSNHPEAIEIIMKHAEMHGELITAQAEILGPWSFAEALETGDWKIVGLDIGWS